MTRWRCNLEVAANALPDALVGRCVPVRSIMGTPRRDSQVGVEDFQPQMDETGSR